MNNKDIRRAAAVAGVRHWRIADSLGMQDSNFSRMLRKELPQKTKSKILQIIAELSERGGGYDE